MDTGPDPARTRIELAGCVALLGVTAALVGTVVPAWAYPIINTTVAVALIAMALAAAATPVAIGLTLGRRTVIATAIGLISVAAVLAAVGWAREAEISRWMV